MCVRAGRPAAREPRRELYTRFIILAKSPAPRPARAFAVMALPIRFEPRARDFSPAGPFPRARPQLFSFNYPLRLLLCMRHAFILPKIKISSPPLTLCFVRSFYPPALLSAALFTILRFVRDFANEIKLRGNIYGVAVLLNSFGPTVALRTPGRPPG